MRLGDDLLKRLEELNGGPLRVGDAEGGDRERLLRRLRNRQLPSRDDTHEVLLRRSVPTTRSAPASVLSPLAAHVELEGAVPGVSVSVPGRGDAWQIVTPVCDLGPSWAGVSDAFSSALRPGDGPLAARIHRRAGLADVRPEDVLFVDLETTGLCHSPLFLIGALVWEGGELVVRQYFARHYGEEAAVTALFLDLAAEKRLLISFNGKSFDLPYVRTRAAALALPCAVQHPHLDLLHECRRAWRGQFADCRLQTLEQHVCDRPPRRGDIPGGLIPDAYHHFVRSGNAVQMVKVIRHNLLDLVTLAELMARLPAEE